MSESPILNNQYEAMKPYIGIVDSIKASEMTKLNGLIKFADTP